MHVLYRELTKSYLAGFSYTTGEIGEFVWNRDVDVARPLSKRRMKDLYKKLSKEDPGNYVFKPYYTIEYTPLSLCFPVSPEVVGAAVSIEEAQCISRRDAKKHGRCLSSYKAVRKYDLFSEEE